MAQVAQTGQIDHPGQQKIIQLRLDLGQGAGGNRRTDQGEVDVESGAVATDGARALQDRLLHFGMGAS
jgi:hypothetical protein